MRLDLVNHNAGIYGLHGQSSFARPISLHDFYNSIFEGVLADTEELKRECYSLRYKIYCEEFGFLDAAENPGNLETDELDSHSVHALLRFRPTGEFVGTVRLVLHPDHANEGIFPVHKLCSQNNLIMPQPVPLKNMAEISRFCMLKDFRRRLTDMIATSSYTTEELEADIARIIPSMSLGLIRMAVVMAKQHNITHWCAEMEPFLLRMLTKLGIHFENVGPLIEYHGMRQICHKLVGPWLDRVASERPDVWDVITDKGGLC